MGLATEAKSAVPYRKYDWVLTRLGDEAAEFEELLADTSVNAADLHRALHKRGIDIPYRTLWVWAKRAREGKIQ